MAVSEEMVLAGAKALHEAWRSWATLSSSKDGLWEDLHQNDRASYLRDSRTALTAALSDQVAVPKSALEWLFGERPDADGKWFGDEIRLEGKLAKPYWWRSKFRAMIAPVPASTPVRSS